MLFLPVLGRMLMGLSREPQLHPFSSSLEGFLGMAQESWPSRDQRLTAYLIIYLFLPAVGLLAVQCAQFRGAKRVILIDNAKYRLEYASQKLPGVELLDFGEHDTVKRLKEMVPNGPDVCIEAVGFHYAKSLMSKVEMAVGLQTDPADIINELIVSCRKVSKVHLRNPGQHVHDMIVRNATRVGSLIYKGTQDVLT